MPTDNSELLPCGCGGRRERWQAVCRDCWKRVPADLRDAIRAAQASKARHLEAKAAMEATDWLRAHPAGAAAARITGESPG